MELPLLKIRNYNGKALPFSLHFFWMLFNYENCRRISNAIHKQVRGNFPSFCIFTLQLKQKHTHTHMNTRTKSIPMGNVKFDLIRKSGRKTRIVIHTRDCSNAKRSKKNDGHFFLFNKIQTINYKYWISFEST